MKKVQEKRKCLFSHAEHVQHTQYLDSLREKFHEKFAVPVKSVRSPDDFDKIQTLGTGGFSTVYLVRDKTSFATYAIKAMDKKTIVNKKYIRLVLLEKLILQSINFPFLISLNFCCKDNVYVYFGLPFESGGELYRYLRKRGPLPDDLAKFFAAQLVLALEYLHHCDVIHRDVKLENVFISPTGYLKLGDYSLSKIIKNRTFTICGTPEYLSPEIITAQGYSFSSDWWALGVVIYEMIAGYPPFYGRSKMTLYDRIVSGRIKIPESMAIPCKLLVKRLLEVDPSKRIGSQKAGVYDIKSHDWFYDIDWNLVFRQQMKLPFVLDIQCENLGDNFPSVAEVKLVRCSTCQYEKEFENF